MRVLVTAAMMMAVAVPGQLNAQRGGSGGGAIARPGFGGGSAAGRFGGATDRGWNRRPGLTGWGFGSFGWSDPAWNDSRWNDPGFYGNPFFHDYYGSPGMYGDGYQASPAVYVLMPVQAPPEPEPPPPPPEPARPVVHEYSWPDDGGDHHATFSIVSRDSKVDQAVAVWVQDNEVRYTKAGGSTGRMALAAIDCGATERLNTEKKLTLWIPGCAASR
jgi:hypothetical protein